MEKKKETVKDVTLAVNTASVSKKPSLGDDDDEDDDDDDDDNFDEYIDWRAKKSYKKGNKII